MVKRQPRSGGTIRGGGCRRVPARAGPGAARPAARPIGTSRRFRSPWPPGRCCRGGRCGNSGTALWWGRRRVRVARRACSGAGRGAIHQDSYSQMITGRPPSPHATTPRQLTRWCCIT